MVSTDVKLSFINRSNSTDIPEVVIFQKNLAPNSDDTAIAWLVIKYCGQGESYSFIYPSEMGINASNESGDYSQILAAQNGQLFQLLLTDSGPTLSYEGSGSSPKQVQLLNALSEEWVSANIFKDGRILAQKSPVNPQQTAVFEIEQTIWIGVVSDIEAGEPMSSTILSTINTEISLLGIASADIVMTGGGSDAKSTPFEFNLENVRTS